MTEPAEIASLLGYHLKHRLRDGAFGLCMTVRFARSAEIAAIAAGAGYDALYVDLEHSTVTLDLCADICRAAAVLGLVPMVRVPSHLPHHINGALAAGAQGIIVPHVDTAEEAAACVEACLYPPVGKRSLSGLGPLAGHDVGPEEAYRLINANTILVAMLESPEAIANADRIAATDGIDMLLIGTNDLCAEMGIPGKLDHPKVRAAYETAAAACKAHGIALGIGGIKGGPMLADIIAMGGNFMLGRVDGQMLAQAAAAEVKEFRALAG